MDFGSIQIGRSFGKFTLEHFFKISHIGDGKWKSPIADGYYMFHDNFYFIWGQCVWSPNFVLVLFVHFMDQSDLGNVIFFSCDIDRNLLSTNHFQYLSQKFCVVIVIATLQSDFKCLFPIGRLFHAENSSKKVNKNRSKLDIKFWQTCSVLHKTQMKKGIFFR